MIGQLVALGIFLIPVLAYTHSILTQPAPNENQEPDR